MNAVTAVWGLGLLIAAAGAGAGGETLGTEQPWEKYEILIERNAFSRTRGPRSAPATIARTPTPRPERYTVLTGISEQDGAFVAFLEEVQGSTTQVEAGDEVAGGTVTEITLDGIVFEKEGKTTKVPIGSSLSLGPAPAGTGVGEASATAAGPATAPAPGTSPKDLATSILERLRRRREEELKNK